MELSSYTLNNLKMNNYPQYSFFEHPDFSFDDRF